MQENEKIQLPKDVLDQRIHQVRKSHAWKTTICCLIVTAVVVYFLVKVVFGIAIVQGDSMSPTYQEGDVVFFSRVGQDYQTGDIILFQLEESTYIKRVVGLPREEFDIEEGSGSVLINAMPLEEPYVYEKTLKKKNIIYPVDLGKDEYFVLGDQRGNSLDSRSYGPIKINQIKGKVIAVLRL